MPQEQQKPPDTLPANFAGWDSKPPDTLPADFAHFDAPQPQGGAVKRFGNNFIEQVNPVTVVKGMAQLAAHPIDTYSGDVGARENVLSKAGSALDAAKSDYAAGHYLRATGDTMDAAAHGLYSMIPFVGPQLSKAADQFNSGDFAGGAGTSTGIGVMLAGPKAIAKVPGAIVKTGGLLTDYAPQIGKAAGAVVDRGGIVKAVTSLARRDFSGAAEGLAGSAASGPVESVASKAAFKIGSGTKWLGNLMTADASGIQPLPLTKAALQNAGLYERFLNSAEMPAEYQPKPYPQMDTAYSREPVYRQPQPETIQPRPNSGPLLLTGDHPTQPPAMDKAYAYEPVANQAPAGQPTARAVQPRRGPLLLPGQTIGSAHPADLPLIKMADDVLGKVSRNQDIRAMNGESALNQILTGQDNANLIKIAKSRGIDVTKEVQLKPGKADAMLIKKIADSFTQDEFDDLGSHYIEVQRNRANFGDIGPEAWKTMSLQTYFPDVKIPMTALKRTRAAIDSAQAAREPLGSVVDTTQKPYYDAAAKATGKDFNDPATVQLAQRLKDQDSDLAAVLQQSIERMKAKKQ